MPSGYHHLTFEQRCRIEALPERGAALRTMARAPGCHVSTIGREVKRNTGRRGYRIKQAHRLATGRGLIPNRVDIREHPAVVDEKTRTGDREVDPIIGSRHRGAVVSDVVCAAGAHADGR